MKLSKGVNYKNENNETLIIKSVTEDNYPEVKVNGAYVIIKDAFNPNNEFEQWMSIEAILNFKNN